MWPIPLPHMTYQQYLPPQTVPPPAGMVAQNMAPPAIQQPNYYATHATESMFYPQGQPRRAPPVSHQQGYYGGQPLVTPPSIPGGPWVFAGSQTGTPHLQRPPYCPKVGLSSQNHPIFGGVMPSPPLPANKGPGQFPPQPIPKDVAGNVVPPRGTLRYHFPPLPSSSTTKTPAAHPHTSKAQGILSACSVDTHRPLVARPRACVASGDTPGLSSHTCLIDESGTRTPTCLEGTRSVDKLKNSLSSKLLQGGTSPRPKSANDSILESSDSDSQRLLFEQKASSHGIRIEESPGAGQQMDSSEDDSGSDTTDISGDSGQLAISPAEPSPPKEAVAWSTSDDAYKAAGTNCRVDPGELYQSENDSSDEVSEFVSESGEDISSEVHVHLGDVNDETESQRNPTQGSTVSELVGHLQYNHEMIPLEKAIGDLEVVQGKDSQSSLEHAVRKLVLSSLNGAKTTVQEKDVCPSDTLVGSIIDQGADSRLEGSLTETDAASSLSYLNPMSKEFKPAVSQNSPVLVPKSQNLSLLSPNTLNAMAAEFKPLVTLSGLRHARPKVMSSQLGMISARSPGNFHTRGIMTLSGAMRPKFTSPTSKILCDANSQTLTTSLIRRDVSINTRRIKTRDSSEQVEFKVCDVAVNTVTNKDFSGLVTLTEVASKSTNTKPTKRHHRCCQVGEASVDLAFRDVGINTAPSSDDFIETIDSLQYDEVVARALAAEEKVLLLQLQISCQELGAVASQLSRSYNTLSSTAQEEWEADFCHITQTLHDDISQLEDTCNSNLALLRDGAQLDSLPALTYTLPDIPPVLQPSTHRGQHREPVSKQNLECRESFPVQYASVDSGLDFELPHDQPALPAHSGSQGALQSSSMTPDEEALNLVDSRETEEASSRHTSSREHTQSPSTKVIQEGTALRLPPGLENLQDPVSQWQSKSTMSNTSSERSRTNSGLSQPEDNIKSLSPSPTGSNVGPPAPVWQDQQLQMLQLQQQQQMAGLSQLGPLIQPMMLTLLQVNPALALQPEVLQMTALQHLVTMQQVGLGPGLPGPPMETGGMALPLPRQLPGLGVGGIPMAGMMSGMMPSQLSGLLPSQAFQIGAGEPASLVPQVQAPSVLNASTPPDESPNMEVIEKGSEGSHMSGSEGSVNSGTNQKLSHRTRYGPRQTTQKPLPSYTKVNPEKEQSEASQTNQAALRRIPVQEAVVPEPSLNQLNLVNKEAQSKVIHPEPSKVHYPSTTSMRGMGSMRAVHTWLDTDQVEERRPPKTSERLDQGYSKKPDRSSFTADIPPRFRKNTTAEAPHQRKQDSKSQHDENWDEDLDPNSRRFFKWQGQTKGVTVPGQTSAVQTSQTSIARYSEARTQKGTAVKPRVSHASSRDSAPIQTQGEVRGQLGPLPVPTVWGTKGPWSKVAQFHSKTLTGSEGGPATPLPVSAGSLGTVQNHRLAGKAEGFKVPPNTGVGTGDIATDSQAEGASGISEITFDDNLNEVIHHDVHDEVEDTWQEAGRKKKKKTKLKFVASIPAAPAESSKSNYDRLVQKLMLSFPHLSRAEAVSLVQEVRSEWGGTLKGSTLAEIISAVQILLASRDQSGGRQAPQDAKPNFLPKTSICPFWRAGTCVQGSQCEYAHGQSELKQLQKHIMCPKWKKGQCIHENKCIYAHGEHELVKDTADGMEKTRRQKLMIPAKASAAATWAEKAQAASNTFLQTDDGDCGNEAETCVICFFKIREPHSKMLECGHKFHYECIMRWLVGEERTCPTCRSHALLVEDFPYLGS